MNINLVYQGDNMYTGNPSTVPRDAVYLYLGLTDPTQLLLVDTEVDYFLQKNNSDVVLACLDCARTVLFKLSQSVRARNDLVEIYEEQKFQQWTAALQEFIKANDPASTLKSVGIALTSAQAYAGNISVSDMNKNEADLDNVLASTNIRDLRPTYYVNAEGINPFLI
jgi:hypothetical protein